MTEQFFPHRKKVLLKLEPDRDRPLGLITVSQIDYMKICKRCGAMLEQIDESICAPMLDWVVDERTDTYILNEVSFAHDPEHIAMPTIQDTIRVAEVLAVGEDWECEMTEGDRVLVRFDAGEPLDGVVDSLIRIVWGHTILGHAED